jgi:hypothetical protein
VAAVLSRDGRFAAGFFRVERDAAARAAVFLRTTFFTARRFRAAAGFRGAAFPRAADFLTAAFLPVFFFATTPPRSLPGNARVASYA